MSYTGNTGIRKWNRQPSLLCVDTCITCYCIDMVTRSRLWGNTVHHRSSVRLQGSPHRTVVPAGHSSNLLLPPSLIQPLPGGGIEVILPWITSPDPAETDVSSAGCSTSSASASAMHHGQQGAPLSQMQGTDVAQSWAHQTAVRFPAMGSGLLWARSTGLKVLGCMLNEVRLIMRQPVLLMLETWD